MMRVPAFATELDDERWLAGRAVAILLQPLQLLTAAPTLLFLAALAAMLLRHPDVPFYEIDRVAFLLLLVGVAARAVVMREPLLFIARASWPMMGLILLAGGSLIVQPFDCEACSLLAAKFVVPFALFHISGIVFTREKGFRQFEIFVLVTLAYLSFTAIAFLVGAQSLIFPRFILDPSLGHHADRARGPLLQAVANGVSLNVLGLLAVHAYRRGRAGEIKAWLLMASLPVAVLATMTRAVWLAFAGSVLALAFVVKSRALRRNCLLFSLVAGAGLAMLFVTDYGSTLRERMQERGPVEYRTAVYAGGWEMFLQKPLIGWGFHRMPEELPRHVDGYREKVLYPHNTYLEILVEHGIVGLAFYFWLMLELLRLGRGSMPKGEGSSFLNREFHLLWPILLAVYWVNAAVVVMSYQFVNGLIFTMAGMLAAQRRRAEA